MTRPTCHRLLHEEDGQALMYGAGVIVLLVALFFGAVDLGQLVLGKIQAQNAADSAAMSASSLKAGVHNTRTIAYRAASGQLTLSRMQLVKATGLAFQELAKPGTKSQKQFKESIKEARGHRFRIEKLRDGIIKFNQWATNAQDGPQAARKAAEIGYLGNIGSLGMADSRNMNLLDGLEALAENGRSAPGTGGQSSTVGGVTYTGEGLNPNGAAGKTLVRIAPRVGAFGAAWLSYSGDGVLPAEAVAGTMLAEKAYGKNPAGLSKYGVNWYTVRLMPIGGAPGQRVTE